MQSDMYPLCPYHDAWKPGIPLGTRAGGAMPGPTLLAHVAARESCNGTSAATSANTSTALKTRPTMCLTFWGDQRYWEVAARCLLGSLTSSDARQARPRTIACPGESGASPSTAAEAECARS